MGTTRQTLEDFDFEEALDEIEGKLNFRQKQKGMHSYASIHECLGILEEEMMEFREEVRDNLKTENQRERQIQELLDIAVGCVWSIASLRAKKVDW
jgi:hypothetical protein